MAKRRKIKLEILFGTAGDIKTTIRIVGSTARWLTGPVKVDRP